MIYSIGSIALAMWLISFSVSPVISKVLLLISIYLSGSYYLAQLGFYFIAISYIIVYIGAVAILFLFIIMICNAESTSSLSTTGQVKIGTFLTTLVLGTGGTLPLVGTVQSTDYLSMYHPALDIQLLSMGLFNSWSLLVVLIGVLLTTCLIGILDTL